MMHLRTTALLAASALALGCSSSTAPSTNADTFGGSATALTVDVNMPALVYAPNHIDILHGGVVNFVFATVAHDVRFTGSSSPADILTSTNTTVPRTFATAGTFTFLCTLHANMTGTVVVH